MIRPFLIAFFVIFVFTPTIQAADKAKHQERLEKHYRLEKPDGTGPFPAVMLVAGCSGFESKIVKAHYDRVQKRLVESGFVTLRVNFLAAREVSNCSRGVKVEDGASDICIAAEYLRQQPFVKKEAVNLLAWSFGGGCAFQALGRTKNREPVQVDAVVVYYPLCNSTKKWDSEVPILVLFGSNDTVVSLSKCKKIFNKLPKQDKITLRVYDDARHAFDVSELPPKKQYQFGTLGYNEAAEKSAWMEVTNFLKK